MKNKLQKWLGIEQRKLVVRDEYEKKEKEFSTKLAKLEKEIGEEYVPPRKDNEFMYFTVDWNIFSPKKTLHSRIKDLRDDFEELDKKFDALERYLQIEYYKEDKETQVYDWADKNHSEGFRKTPKTYEQMKKAKGKRRKERHG